MSKEEVNDAKEILRWTKEPTTTLSAIEQQFIFKQKPVKKIK